MIAFKDFRCARIILSGIETMHMIRKGQIKDGGVARTAAQFYSLDIGILIIQNFLFFRLYRDRTISDGHAHNYTSVKWFYAQGSYPSLHSLSTFQSFAKYFGMQQNVTAVQS